MAPRRYRPGGCALPVRALAAGQRRSAAHLHALADDRRRLLDRYLRLTPRQRRHGVFAVALGTLGPLAIAAIALGLVAAAALLLWAGTASWKRGEILAG